MPTFHPCRSSQVTQSNLFYQSNLPVKSTSQIYQSNLPVKALVFSFTHRSTPLNTPLNNHPFVTSATPLPPPVIHGHYTSSVMPTMFAPPPPAPTPAPQQPPQPKVTTHYSPFNDPVKSNLFVSYYLSFLFFLFHITFFSISNSNVTFLSPISPFYYPRACRWGPSHLPPNKLLPA